MPRLRMQAVKLVINQGWSVRQVARHTGFSHSTIVRWVNKAKLFNSNARTIPTESSRPKRHPNSLSKEAIKAILKHRFQYGRCAEVIHYDLSRQGVKVSLSSVKRTLKRYGLTYPSKWKKWHKYPKRPLALKPGILVQIDSMREGLPKEGMYVYALIDVCSRWAHAKPARKVNSWESAGFYREARDRSPFPIQLIQSDHGSEFAKWFSKQLLSDGIKHRHSRVRRPTDNSHVERFIRTIQQECLARTTTSFKSWQKNIPEFIKYYNNSRPHMGLNMQTPMEVVRSY